MADVFGANDTAAGWRQLLGQVLRLFKFQACCPITFKKAVYILFDPSLLYSGQPSDVGLPLIRPLVYAVIQP